MFSISSIEMIAVFFSVLGVVFAIKRSIYCWLFYFIASILYAYVFYTVKLYGETLLQLFFILMSLYGLLLWSLGKRKDHDIQIEPISRQLALLLLVFAGFAGVLFGLLLQHFTDAAVPMLDSQLAAFSLLATYWTSRKHVATWPLWVVIDLLYVAMFVYKDLFLTAALYAVFVGLAILGWRQWTQVQNKQQLQKKHSF